MIKILLQLSLLLASSMTTGDTLASAEEDRLLFQHGYCDQSDSQNIDSEENDPAAASSLPDIVYHPATLSITEFTGYSSSTSSYRYLIRAPPTSL